MVQPEQGNATNQDQELDADEEEGALDRPTLSDIPSRDEQVAIMSNLPSAHGQLSTKLMAKYRKDFCKWASQLEHGGVCSLLVQGYGCKIKLLEAFAEYVEKNCTGVAIEAQAFKGEVTVKGLLDLLCSVALPGLSEKARAALARVSLPDYASVFSEAYSQALEGSDDVISPSAEVPGQIWLVLHTIEGFTADGAQRALSELAKHQHIHIVASADHINVGLLWNSQLSNAFKWRCLDCPTYESYQVELDERHERDYQEKARKLSGFEGIQTVMQGMAARHLEVLGIVAKQVKAGKEGHGEAGMTKEELREHCEDRMITTTISVDQYMVELLDHNLLEKVASKDGGEMLTVPHPLPIINQILEFIPVALQRRL
ncbi:unnamed protein product [Chrysoparadoxa australica]